MKRLLEYSLLLLVASSPADSFLQRQNVGSASRLPGARNNGGKNIADSHHSMSATQAKTAVKKNQDEAVMGYYESAIASQYLHNGVEIDATQCDIQRSYSARPENCPQRVERFNYADLEVSVIGFTQIWKEMQSSLSWNICCMGLNHRFVVYHLLTSLKPLAVVESGVAAGHTTWMLRRTVGKDVPIFSIDPQDPSVEYNKSTGGWWKDAEGSKTTYFTGLDFKDLSGARWDQIIPDPAVRARTLVILDDHQSAVQRLKMMQKWGFRYFYYDDNYPYNVATTDDKYTCNTPPLPGLFHNQTSIMFGDAYSPNTMCASLPPGTKRILEKDQFGHKCRWLTVPEHMKNVHWMQQNMESYFEFPAVFSPCSNLSRPALLGNDPNILPKYGFPPPQGELWHYGHLYPAFIELKSLPPIAGKRELALAISSTQEWLKTNANHWVR